MTTERNDFFEDDFEEYADSDDDPSGYTFEYRLSLVLKEYLGDEQGKNFAYGKEIWYEICNKVNQLVIEYYDQGLEDGIAELVVAMNILGIKTIGSCEGHFFRAVAHYKENGIDVRSVSWKSPWINFMYKPDELKLTRLRQLIDEFYKERDVAQEYMITMYVGDTGNQGIEIDGDSKKEIILRNGDDEEKIMDEITMKVEKQQKEIRDFTIFLRKKFIQTGFL